MAAVSRDVLLNHNVVALRDRNRTAIAIDESLAVIRSPSLRLRLVEEGPTLSGLDDQRPVDLDLIEVVELLRIPGSRCGNTECLSQAVGPSLVACPTGGLPRRRRDAKCLAQGFAVSRDRHDLLVARREEHPSSNRVTPGQLPESGDRRGGFAQVANADRESGVARMAGDRVLVVEDTDRNAKATQTPDDAETLIVASQHHRPNSVMGTRHAARRWPARPSAAAAR